MTPENDMIDMQPKARKQTRNLSAPVGSTDDKALVLERIFDAPPETVFELWTDPEHVKEWWHPDDYTTPAFEMDFRVGGAYRFCIRKDGKDQWAHGTYREIDAPRRLVFSFQWGESDAAAAAAKNTLTLITLTFAPAGDDTTRMTFRQEDFASTEDRHSHGKGWTQFLESFARFLAAQGKPA
jgi:uncharacterized protein YndB with AHSA1/START domain